MSNTGTTAGLTAGGSIADRQACQDSGAFRGGSRYASAYTNLAQSTGAQINSYGQGSAAGSCVVQRAGETLRSVAQQLWGDSSLWYKLAETNGMSGDTTLTEGQRLSLPAGVSRSHHNAAALPPYDPNAARRADAIRIVRCRQSTTQRCASHHTAAQS